MKTTLAVTTRKLLQVPRLATRVKQQQLRVTSTSSQRHPVSVFPASPSVAKPAPQNRNEIRLASSDTAASAQYTSITAQLDQDTAVDLQAAVFQHHQEAEEDLQERQSFFDNGRLSFDDHTQAFQAKTTWEVVRALSILRMCSNQYLVDNSLELMTACRRLFGRRLLSAVIKPTIYKQFVGGETPNEIHKCVQSLKYAGIRPLLACTVEEDVGESDHRPSEAVYYRNQTKVLNCLELTSSLETPSPMMQLKISGLLNPNLLALMSEFYTKSPSRQNLVEAVAELMAPGGKDILHLRGVEYEKVVSIKNGIKRLQEIGQVAKEKGIKVLVDAEYTYLNPALNWLTIAMMAIFNQEEPLIWNTYQCYLKDALKSIRHDLALAETFDTCFGAKIVRGAYLSQERSRAAAMNYPDPVCDNYEATNANYQKVLDFLLNHIKTSNKDCNIIIATHNEESVKHAVQKMKDLDISQDSGSVCFGQLLGMCDQVTYPLAAAKYNVYKSIPYGPLDEVLPYLARRAMENKTVLAGARKELQLLNKELKARFLKPFTYRKPLQANLQTSG